MPLPIQAAALNPRYPQTEASGLAR